MSETAYPDESFLERQKESFANTTASEIHCFKYPQANVEKCLLTTTDTPRMSSEMTGRSACVRNTRTFKVRQDGRLHDYHGIDYRTA